MVSDMSIMTGEERRNRLLNTIREADAPISGAALAKQYQVSRQVIVQDMALLRAAHHEVYATPKGYVFHHEQDGTAEENEDCDTVCSREYRVAHTDEQIEDELNTIVDMGGRVIDVVIKHEIYGTIRADLPINCRRQAQEFAEEIKSGKSRPLNNLMPDGIHYHTVEAESEETLDLIEQELQKKGYLR